jgi:hypothetical protein
MRYLAHLRALKVRSPTMKFDKPQPSQLLHLETAVIARVCAQGAKGYKDR